MPKPRRGRWPPRLERRSASRDPKPRIIVVCEGRLTEPSYFDALARYCGANTIVDLVLVRGAGVPLSVVREARRIKSESQDEYSDRDQTWAVFDRDEHPGFEQAINEAKSSGVFVAYSNPCFELWLVLHYQEHDAPIDRAQIQRILRRLMPAYDPNGSKRIEFSAIRDAVVSAERRAERMERRRAEEATPRGNPSCSVYQLTREIRKRVA